MPRRARRSQYFLPSTKAPVTPSQIHPSSHQHLLILFLIDPSFPDALRIQSYPAMALATVLPPFPARSSGRPTRPCARLRRHARVVATAAYDKSRILSVLGHPHCGPPGSTGSPGKRRMGAHVRGPDDRCQRARGSHRATTEQIPSTRQGLVLLVQQMERATVVSVLAQVHSCTRSTA